MKYIICPVCKKRVYHYEPERLKGGDTIQAYHFIPCRGFAKPMTSDSIRCPNCFYYGLAKPIIMAYRIVNLEKENK